MQCQYFLEKHLDDLMAEQFFKLKKFLLPALIAISEHLDYDSFTKRVFTVFTEYYSDEIWGIRKVCIENMPQLVKHIQATDGERLDQCIEFFKRCLHDSNRWVKNQALIQFGPFVHNIFLKIETSQNKEQLQERISRLCLIYYDMKLAYPGSEDNVEESNEIDKDLSFMTTKNEDVDKIKYYWAYNLPCALLVNGKNKFWLGHLKQFYILLYKDILLNLRTTVSASFKEVIELIDFTDLEESERQFFVDVLNHFLEDTEDIQAKVLPTLCTLVSKFPAEDKAKLLDSLIRNKIEAIKSMKNARDNMIKMLE